MGARENENEKYWILRKFADNGKKHIRWKRADVLRKPNGISTFSDPLLESANLRKIQVF